MRKVEAEITPEPHPETLSGIKPEREVDGAGVATRYRWQRYLTYLMSAPRGGETGWYRGPDIGPVPFERDGPFLIFGPERS